MTNHPTGDTALSRAITTGAPVATNDKQAAELTQKWGEFTTRGSTVYRDDTSYAVCVNPRAATSIARRINAADAMEKALKEAQYTASRAADALRHGKAGIAEAIVACDMVDRVTRKAAAALRGGA